MVIGDESSLGRWILGLGAGCLIFILLIGLVMSFAIFRGGQCCNNRISQASKAQMEPIDELLLALGQHRDEDAYQALGVAFKDKNSFESFEAFINAEDDLFRGGTARFVSTRRDQRTPRRYFMTVQIVDIGGDTVKGVATFLMVAGASKNDQGYRRADIEEIFVGVPAARIAEDEIRAMLQAHVDRLGRGEFKAASADLDSGPEAMDPKTYRQYIDAHGTLFKGGRVEIVEVNTERRMLLALVEVRDAEGEAKGQARFALLRDSKGGLRGRLKIVSIETTDFKAGPSFEGLPGAEDEGGDGGKSGEEGTKKDSDPKADPNSDATPDKKPEDRAR